jgi:Protein of unknown function (DUF2628)
MAIYTVHAPPDTPPEAVAERMVFVKDGFSWPALLIPLIWLLYRRLWLGLLLYLAFVALVVAVDAGLGETAAQIVAVLGAILFALEANNLRRWQLARRGWREVGETEGRGLEEAELRFFHRWAARPEPAAAPAPRVRPQAPWGRMARAPEGDDPHVLGLFPERDA